ncbi:putative inorganic phosphate cotransporter isoform X2 [Fopius arisanus]|uniref:Inorganic phosphate cotransporter isoform X2 n=1 Tax=Fopius arisanus TaxID=64838 RepID=A0A9R1U693_9HYME|nr:PREDICTED: putative inorganic phosphate cotransporter isoform X2 [Fopius arisanus]
MTDNGAVTVPRIPGFLGIRHLQCVLCFLGITIAYANRVCMSIAIVAIKEEVEKNGSILENVGPILSSFFWGYTLMQIPSGHLARIWSAKMVFSIGVMLNGVGCMLCPIFFDQGGWILLCICRVIMGLSQACCLPCIHTLLSKWVPPNERGRLCTMTYAGAQFGTVISYPISGAMIEFSGWRSVFYSFGAVAVIWSLSFFFIGSDSPAASAGSSLCRIGDTERKYIECGLGVHQTEDSAEKKKIPKTPWGSILTSLPFWSLVAAHCGQNWGFWTLITETSIYMNGVLGFDITENGLKSALPYLAMLFLTFPVSYLSDWAQTKGLSRGASRKICNTIGHWGPGLALIGICFVSPGDTTTPVILLVIAGGLNVGAVCGFQINHMDLSPNYAGLLMAFTNCAAAIVALLAPLIVGEIVTDDKNADQWKIVFYLSGGIYFVGNLMFIIFGSGETQPWDDITKSNRNDEGVIIKLRSSASAEDTLIA